MRYSGGEGEERGMNRKGFIGRLLAALGVGAMWPRRGYTITLSRGPQAGTYWFPLEDKVPPPPPIHRGTVCPRCGYLRRTLVHNVTDDERPMWWCRACAHVEDLSPPVVMYSFGGSGADFARAVRRRYGITE